MQKMLVLFMAILVNLMSFAEITSDKKEVINIKQTEKKMSEEEELKLQLDQLDALEKKEQIDILNKQSKQEITTILNQVDEFLNKDNIFDIDLKKINNLINEAKILVIDKIDKEKINKYANKSALIENDLSKIINNYSVNISILSISDSWDKTEPIQVTGWMTLFQKPTRFITRDYAYKVEFKPNYKNITLSRDYKIPLTIFVKGDYDNDAVKSEAKTFIMNINLGKTNNFSYKDILSLSEVTGATYKGIEFYLTKHNLSYEILNYKKDSIYSYLVPEEMQNSDKNLLLSEDSKCLARVITENYIKESLKYMASANKDGNNTAVLVSIHPYILGFDSLKKFSVKSTSSSSSEISSSTNSLTLVDINGVKGNFSYYAESYDGKILTGEFYLNGKDKSIDISENSYGDISYNKF